MCRFSSEDLLVGSVNIQSVEALVIFVLGISVFVGPFIVAGVVHSLFDSFAFVWVLARSLVYLVLG